MGRRLRRKLCVRHQKSMMTLNQQIEILKGQVAEQQKSIQEAYIRIKELVEEQETEKKQRELLGLPCKYCGK